MAGAFEIINPEAYSLCKQRSRILYTQIYILNFKMQKVAEISGMVLDGSTFSIDSTSDIRRTCNISIVPTSSSLEVAKDSSIWIDKYIQVYVGIKNMRTNNISYSNMGIYLINNPNRVYSASNNTLTISGIDLMAKLTGMRNGYLSGTVGATGYQIPAYSPIKRAIKSAIGLGGFTKCAIATPESPEAVVTPQAINVSVGNTIYDMLKQLCDINSNYQMYFDTNGAFNYNKIPNGDNEVIMIDDDLWKNVLIEYNSNISFEEVKNYVEVYGKTLSDGTVPYGVAQETNPNSPFYVNGTAGKINIVLSGGEYDNIYSTELAQQRANYELYLRCRLQDQVTIQVIPIYWLDVNWLVELTLPNKLGEEEKELYIIKKIDTTVGTNGTQSITLMKYYPTA